MSGAGHAAYREAHPFPYVLLHWTHLAAMVVLALTGLVIHYPFVPLRMGVVRVVHLVAAYTLLVALAARVWYAAVGRTAVRKDTREVARDVRNFLPQPGDRAALAATLRYYLFLQPDEPGPAKYNPLQKLAYVAIAGLLVLQALTGFALYGPALDGPLGGAFALLAAAFGGPMGVRAFHYLLTWVFAAITIVHVYLAVSEDPAGLPLMFLMRETLPPDSAEESADAV